MRAVILRTTKLLCDYQIQLSTVLAPLPATQSRRHHGTTKTTTNTPPPKRPIRYFSAAPTSIVVHDPCQLEHYNAHVNDNGKELTVSFNNNHHPVSALFHAPWLWSNDPAFIHTTSGQRLRTTGEYSGTTIESVSIVPAGTVDHVVNPPTGSLHPIGGVYEPGNSDASTVPLLEITWKYQNTKTYYNIHWLQERVYGKELSTKASEVTTRNAITKIQNHQDPMQHFSFSLLSQDSEFIFQLLHSIVQNGAALVTDAPTISTGPEASVRTIGQWLSGSTLSHGALYGDLFQVQSLPDAINIAYTNVSLPPHIDLGYYESPPGLQLLHCISNDAIGGESILIDAMAAANEFRQLCPDLFEILVKCPATFVKQREGVDMVYYRPHIVVQNDEIVGVNWSPPFEGPLQLVPPHLVEDYYVAYCAFQKMLDTQVPLEHGQHALSLDLCQNLHEYAKEYTWERRLEPGDVLVFNNRRMLHGRREFSMLDHYDQSTGFGRHLTGGYTNIDETLSRYRVFLRERRNEYPSVVIPNIGNGSNSTW